MVVVPAARAHLDAIDAIEQECYSTPWSRETLARELADADVTGFVAMTEAAAAYAVVGYTFMRRSFDEGHIENIAVDPAARGRGAASALMDALVAWAQENDLASIALEVRQGNRAAMALYHKYAFRVDGYRRNYYTNPSEDAVLMRKTL